MTDALSKAIIGIATLVVLSALIITLFPNVFSAAGSIKSSAGDVSDRALTSGAVINYDIIGATLQADVLNTGKVSLPCSRINMTALYLSNTTYPSQLIRLSPEAETGAPSWTYAISGTTDGSWDPGDTLTMNVSNYGPFTPDNYQLKLILYNGAIIQYNFQVK